MNEIDRKPKSKRCTKSCVAFGCSNVANLDSRMAGITFHAFPMSNPDRVKVWEHAMHRVEFKATKWSRVCSTHFTPDCFDRTGQTVRLNEGAAPTIFSLPSHLQKNSKPRRAPKDRSVLLPTNPGSQHLTEPAATVTASSSKDNTDHSYSLPSPRMLKRRLFAVHQRLEATQKRLKSSQQRCRRLAVKLNSMKDVIHDLKNKQLLSQQAAENLSASFSGPALDLVMSCLKKGSGESVRSYPPELRAFALTLQFYSSKAYDYVRQTFNKCLPHPQSISSWYKCVNGNPGFHDEVFLALESRARGSAGGRMLCSFMMDEIAIRKQLDFDSATDKFVGYVDMGIEIDDMASLPVANEALVFMIVSLTENWKVPVAYFLLAGLNGSERSNLVKLCLEKLFAVGVDVVSLTFDGCSANITMAKLLGASFEADSVKSCFPHPCDSTKSVSVFLDACHMLKLIRNTLAEKSKFT